MTLDMNARRRVVEAVQAVYDTSYPPDILPPPVTGPPPTITSLTPSSIVVNTSTLVALVGTGFTASGRVLVDGISHPTTFVDATHVSYTALASSPGSQDVRYFNGELPSQPRTLTVTATQEDADALNAAAESESGQEPVSEPQPEPEPAPEPAPAPEPEQPSEP